MELPGRYGDWLWHRHRHRSGPQLPADTTNTRWGPSVATRGAIRWPPPGTLTRPWTAGTDLW